MGDIHGNLPAFEQMLEREKNNYDSIVCHGDTVNYGPWSNECIDLLETLPHCTKLRGNHEDDFLKGVYSGRHPVATAFFHFNYPLFERHNVIEKYDQVTKVGDFTIQHTIDGKYIFENTEIEIDTNYIVGHSHHQFKREMASFVLANTGSVGQNRAFIDEVNYLLLDSEKGKIDLKKFVYDYEIIVNEFRARHYPMICIEYYQSKPRASDLKNFL